MRKSVWVVMLAGVGLLAGPASAWQWGENADPSSEKYRFEAAFQPGFALSRRADQGTYWGDFGWHAREHSVFGINGGFFPAATDARQASEIQTNGVVTTVNTTSIETGENHFFYVGPFWRHLFDLPGWELYTEAGAGPAVQYTHTNFHITDHLNGNAVQVIDSYVTQVNAAIAVGLGADFSISGNSSIGFGLRDLAVIRSTDPSGYPADKVRPLNSVIPYASFRFRF